MKQQIKAGQIGMGGRGKDLLEQVIIANDKVTVNAVCDVYQDRVEAAQEIVKKARGTVPFGTLDYKELVEREDVDLVIITSAWENHIPAAIYAMEHGKMVAMEVAGAYSVQQCWDLVHAHEKARVPFMFLENCCYGRREMMILNMVRQGLLGKVVHCEGGYHHDLRDEVAFGKENRHYRLRNYLNRNCENYPTHELGPIANVLGINRGNRMLSLVSIASKAVGLKDYIKAKKSDDEELMNATVNQGDVVKTIIKCAGGETICLTLDTTLPTIYSRGFQIHGTKGMYMEENDHLYLEDEHEPHVWKSKPYWGNAEQYEEKYLHPVWKKYMEGGVHERGHDGVDWLEFDRMFDCNLEGRAPELDVYDAAAWMCITALSEKSIALGGMPVEVPDFTNGMWTMRKPIEFKA